MMKSVGPIDVDGDIGGTVTLPPVVGTRSQVIAEDSGRGGAVKGRIHDAADEERKSAMRAFFRTACAEGLDCKAAERMRREIRIGWGVRFTVGATCGRASGLSCRRPCSLAWPGKWEVGSQEGATS